MGKVKVGGKSREKIRGESWDLLGDWQNHGASVVAMSRVRGSVVRARSELISGVF